MFINILVYMRDVEDFVHPSFHEKPVKYSKTKIIVIKIRLNC